MSWSEAGAGRRLGRAVRAALGASTLTLTACGFEPLYAPGGPAAAAAGRVEVAVIDGSPGFAMRERLVDQLGAAVAPTHRLDVALVFDREGVAITERDVTSRFDVVAVADWRLYPLGADQPVLADRERAVTGYSAPSTASSSAFAVLSAQRDAEERLALLLADRVAQRIALAAADWSGAQAAVAPGDAQPEGAP